MKRYLATITACLGLTFATCANACLPNEPWSDDRHRTHQAALWVNAETVYILRVDSQFSEPPPSDTFGPSISASQTSVTPILGIKGSADLPAPFIIRESGGGCVGGPFARSRPGDLFVVYVASAQATAKALAQGQPSGGTVSTKDLRDPSTLAAWESARGSELP